MGTILGVPQPLDLLPTRLLFHKKEGITLGEVSVLSAITCWSAKQGCWLDFSIQEIVDDLPEWMLKLYGPDSQADGEIKNMFYQLFGIAIKTLMDKGLIVTAPDDRFRVTEDLAQLLLACHGIIA